MSWSYNADQLMTNPKDQVRFFVGDVVESDPLVQDEEILFALHQSKGNVHVAAGVVCESIASMYSRQADKQTGDVRESLSQRAKAFSERAKDLRAQGSASVLASVKPFAGGITVAGKQANQRNTNLVQPFFRRDQFGGA